MSSRSGATDNSDGDDSDEWATEELPDLPAVVAAGSATAAAAAAAQQDDDDDDDDDEGWERKLPQPPPPSSTQREEQANEAEEEGFAMIIVDLTRLSRGAIHSRFDASAVNDPAAAKKLRLEVERDYYYNNNNNSNNSNKNKNATQLLIADGTVLPCGSTVWRPALEQLRKERPGHYFCPVFPPKPKQPQQHHQQQQAKEKSKAE